MVLSAANTVDVELLVDSDNEEDAKEGDDDEGDEEDDDVDEDDESVSRSSLEFVVSTNLTLLALPPLGLYLSINWPQSSTFFCAIEPPVAPSLNLIGG